MKKNWLSHLGATLVFPLIFALGLPTAVFAAENLPPGFIALSESKMNLADAKAFCQQKGGRLPLIDGSTSSLRPIPQGTVIDGFGAVGDPWPSGLPGGWYGTGTEIIGEPGIIWVVHVGVGGKVVARNFRQDDATRVVCVPK
jgi:hypothetical protein